MIPQASQPPQAIRKYVATLSDFELAMHLEAYVRSNQLYNLPPYLVAILHEASRRLQEPEHEDQN